MLIGCQFLMIGISVETDQAVQGGKSGLLPRGGHCGKVQSKFKRLL